MISAVFEFLVIKAEDVLVFRRFYDQIIRMCPLMVAFHDT